MQPNEHFGFLARVLVTAFMIRNILNLLEDYPRYP
jgi:hypothetical protein